MRIFVIMRLQPGIDPAQLAPHGRTEAGAVWREIAAGRFRQVLLTTNRPGAVIEMEAADVTEAEAAMAALPLVANGFVEVEYLPVAPYRNLEALFAG